MDIPNELKLNPPGAKEKLAMRLKILSYSAAVCASLAAAAALTISAWYKKAESAFPFPTKLQDLVRLTGKIEKMRCPRYDDEHRRVLHSVILYRNGDAALVYYRENGTVSEFSHYHGNENATCQTIDISRLKLWGKMDATGRNVLTVRGFDENGIPNLIADRQKDGSFLEEQFHPGGIVLARKRLWNAKAVLQKDDSFWFNRNLRSTFVRFGTYDTEVKTFFENGLPESYKKEGYYQKEGWFRWSDGKTSRLGWKISYAILDDYFHYHVDTVYYDRQGNVDHYRVFALETMTVKRGMPEFGVVNQTWKLLDKSLPVEKRFAQDNYILKDVQLRSFNGMTDLVYRFSERGHLEAFEYNQPGNNGRDFRMKKKIRPDGSVAKLEVVTATGLPVFSREFSGSEGGMEVVPAELVAVIPYLTPPELPFDPSPYHGDD